MPDHPVLPTGYDSTENNGDELNGAGVNEAVWPALFDSFIGLAPLIVTDEMADAFDGCADYVVPCENSTVMIPYEPDTVVIR